MTKDQDIYFTCQKCGEINSPCRVIRKELKKPSYYKGKAQNFMLKAICAHCGAYRKFVSPENEEYLLIAESE